MYYYYLSFHVIRRVLDIRKNSPWNLLYKQRINMQKNTFAHTYIIILVGLNTFFEAIQLQRLSTYCGEA